MHGKRQSNAETCRSRHLGGKGLEGINILYESLLVPLTAYIARTSSLAPIILGKRLDFDPSIRKRSKASHHAHRHKIQPRK